MKRHQTVQVNTELIMTNKSVCHGTNHCKEHWLVFIFGCQFHRQHKNVTCPCFLESDEYFDAENGFSVTEKALPQGHELRNKTEAINEEFTDLQLKFEIKEACFFSLDCISPTQSEGPL